MNSSVAVKSRVTVKSRATVISRWVKAMAEAEHDLLKAMPAGRGRHGARLQPVVHTAHVTLCGCRSTPQAHLDAVGHRYSSLWRHVGDDECLQRPTLPLLHLPWGRGMQKEDITGWLLLGEADIRWH
eukprot:362201-Chlamydomonas_euryale.AAC.11